MNRRTGLVPSCIPLGMLTAVLLGFAAQDVRSQYDPNAAEPIPRLKGTLFLGGGGDLPGEVYARFIEMAGGDEAQIVVLAAVGQDPGVGQLTGATTLFSGTRRRAQAGAFVRRLEGATGVWIAGDDGDAFVEIFAGTPVEEALRELIANGGVVGTNGGVSRALTAVMMATASTDAETGTGLGLVPGAMVDVGFADVERKMRMVEVVSLNPAVVGLGIDTGTVMILHQRFIDVLGAGNVYSYIAANDYSPARVEMINRQASPASQRRTPERQAQTEAIIAEWSASQQQAQGGQRGQRGQRGRGQRGRGQRGRGQRGRGGRGRGQGQAERPFQPRRLADLMAMSREAVQRTLAQFPAEEPPEPRLENGTLIIVGGGGSPPGLTERFIELAGGADDAYLVYVPCSEAEEINAEPGIVDSWRRMGVRSVAWIHTKDRYLANNDETILRHLRKATGIWFGGGRQWNLVDSYQNTTAHKLMEEVLARGGVIGGSSAGASIQGSYMIRGNSVGNIDPMAPGYHTGLGFISMAIDQHFTQRGRLPDMTEFANKYPQMLGVGLDEASSIIVQGSMAEVFTREGRNVHFYDRRREVVEGEPDYVQLVHGQEFDLVERVTYTLGIAEASAEVPADGPVDYSRDIRPILAENCFTCHGPDAQPRGGLRLDTRDGALGLLPSGNTAVVPGEPGLSELVSRIRAENPQDRMPRRSPALSASDMSLLERWIEEGAPWETQVAPAAVAEEVVEEVAEENPFVGKWALTSYSDFGDSTSSMTIHPDLTLSYEVADFEVSASDVVIEGETIAFAMGFGNSGTAASFQASLSDGVLTGTISFDGQVFAQVEGRKVGGEAAAPEVEAAVPEPTVPEPAAEAQFIGVWDVTAYTDGGENTISLQITPDLEVSFESSEFEVETSNLKIEGDQLSFNISGGGGQFSTQFQATLAEGVLTGTISVEGQVFVEVEGRKRDDVSAAAPAVVAEEVVEEVAEENPFVGRWEVTSVSDFGENTNILRIGPDLSVVYENSQFEVSVSDVVIEGETIRFAMGFGNSGTAASFQGSLSDGVLTGTISFDGQVFAEFEGRKLDGRLAPAA